MGNIIKPVLNDNKCIKKYNKPILHKDDIPYEATCIFNAGVVKYNGEYIMVFRNDYGFMPETGGFKGCNLGIAKSSDGLKWTVSKTPFLTASDMNNEEITRVYDPRLTVIEDELYMCFAVDTRHGVCGGIAKIKNLEEIKVLSISVPDNRNMVLFPEKINGKYVRLERPFPVYSRGGKDRFDIWISESPDLIHWGNSKLLLAVEDVPFANDKIGPAAPPVKTDKGWLTTFHAVDIDNTRGKNGWEQRWTKRYTAGIMLLDLDEPSKVKGICKTPLIAPKTEYETDGYRANVIFPGGMIKEENGEVKIYYGASDTVECLATANVNELLEIIDIKE